MGRHSSALARMFCAVMPADSRAHVSWHWGGGGGEARQHGGACGCAGADAYKRVPRRPRNGVEQTAHGLLIGRQDVHVADQKPVHGHAEERLHRALDGRHGQLTRHAGQQLQKGAQAGPVAAVVRLVRRLGDGEPRARAASMLGRAQQAEQLAQALRSEEALDLLGAVGDHVAVLVAHNDRLLGAQLVEDPVEEGVGQAA